MDGSIAWWQVYHGHWKHPRDKSKSCGEYSIFSKQCTCRNQTIEQPRTEIVGKVMWLQMWRWLEFSLISSARNFKDGVFCWKWLLPKLVYSFWIFSSAAVISTMMSLSSQINEKYAHLKFYTCPDLHASWRGSGCEFPDKNNCIIKGT